MKTTDIVPNNTNCEYWAKEIYRYPKFLDELSDYQISVLKDFLIKGKARAALFFNDFLLANPDLKWEDIKSDDFRIYDKVLSFIESHNKEADKKSDQKSDPEIIELITQCLQLELMREPTERELMDEIADWMKDPTMIKPGSFRPLIELIKKNNDQFQKIKDIIRHALPTIRKKFDIIPNMKFFREFIDLECEFRDCSYSEILSDDPEKLIKEYAEYYNKKYTNTFSKKDKSNRKRNPNQNETDLTLEKVLNNVDVSKVEDLLDSFLKDLGHKRAFQKDITLFLKHLRDKNYFTPKLSDLQLNIIAKKILKKDYKFDKHDIPPSIHDKAWNSRGYRIIPQNNTTK